MGEQVRHEERVQHIRCTKKSRNAWAYVVTAEQGIHSYACNQKREEQNERERNRERKKEKNIIRATAEDIQILRVAI